jgi:hypothetical protein
MSIQEQDQTLDRRGFLKVVTVTALAATATGAGAALLTGQSTAVSPQTAVLPPSAPIAPVSAASQTQASELLAQLAASQAENMRLQAALDAAQRQIDSWQQSHGSAASATETLRAELDATHNQLGIMSGLVALYEQLEDVDVEGAVNAGLTAVSGTMLDLIDQIPTLEEGLEAGRLALDELEEQIPLVENGRNWLYTQANNLQFYYSAVETLLARAADGVKPFLEMFNDWAQDVLKWLPFGLGERTGNILQAITDLLTETPRTVSGLQENVGRPLDAWLGNDGDSTPLQQNLVGPMRERVLAKTNDTIRQTQLTHTVYQTQLAEPTQTAVQNRQTVREVIAQYRQQHQLERV